MAVVFMFPGQSSCYPGMLDKLIDLHAPNSDSLGAASEILGRNLAAHYRQSNLTAFDRNVDIQIGVFLANHFFLQILQDAGVSTDISLGLSLGEWNHLVHIGAVSFEHALRAVEQRGDAYDAGPRGKMAAVFPIDLEELEGLVEKARDRGVVEVVNINSPRQQVIAGDQDAIDAAVEIVGAESFASAIIIEKQVPMHCSVFEGVGRRFKEYLRTVPFASPKGRYLPNRLGDFVHAPQPETFVDLLSTHVHQPVLWRQSVDRVVSKWPDAILVEVGPKSVLTGLFGRRWHRSNRRLHTDSDADTARHLENVIAELAPAVH